MISFTAPILCSGIIFVTVSRFSGHESRSIPSVPAIGPGAMTFEVMPYGPNSMEAEADIESTADFAADTCACSGVLV